MMDRVFYYTVVLSAAILLFLGGVVFQASQAPAPPPVPEGADHVHPRVELPELTAIQLTCIAVPHDNYEPEIPER